MSDPKRLLDDLDAGSDAGSLLRAMRAPEAPSPEKQTELVQRMLTLSVAPVAAGIGAKSWFGAGAALVTVGAAATFFLWPAAESAPRVRPPLAPVVASAPQVTPPEPPPQRPAIPAAPEPSPPGTPPASAVSGKPSARDTLAEEEALLEQARRALGSSPRAALGLLRQHQQRFPGGQLTAERMFLSVDALRRAGDSAGAERQAQALLKRFPSSVYAGQLRRQAAP
ncbi:MAG TPA: hypothetical protein VHP33_33470 [Polyangiaceae bacterium]|nr:hypothetical protein [Polyangiaceae bacterium]